jgi:hypothetical protein
VFSCIAVITVKLTPLEDTEFTVTTTLPLVAPAGTGTVIEPGLHPDGAACVPLNETVLDPCVEPKPVPVIVINAPAEPEVGDKVATLGITVNAALLATPPTVTTMLPLPAVAAFGTAAVMEVGLQFVATATVPLKATVLVPCGAPNPNPETVIATPAMPDVDDKLVTVGKTVNNTPLLEPPFTVTTTLPVVAAAGIAKTIDVAFQVVGAAKTPLAVTALVP